MTHEFVKYLSESMMGQVSLRFVKQHRVPLAVPWDGELQAVAEAVETVVLGLLSEQPDLPELPKGWRWFPESRVVNLDTEKEESMTVTIRWSPQREVSFESVEPEPEPEQEPDLS